MDLLVPLFSLIAPFVLWPIEYYFPYPFIIEELAKGLLVFLVIRENITSKQKITYAVIVGTLFALSESVLYLFNIQLVGSLETFFQRLFLTACFHSLTTLVILLPSLYRRKLIIIGLIFAQLIHYIFNLWVNILDI